MSIIDFYALNYGWRRDYILDYTYIDEYFILQNKISKRKKNEQREKYLMQSYISMLPQMKEESRKEFFNQLFNEDLQQGSLMNNLEPIETDFEQFDRVKQQMQMM